MMIPPVNRNSLQAETLFWAWRLQGLHGLDLEIMTESELVELYAKGWNTLNAVIIEMKQDGNDFARFDDLLRKVVKVPKDEILEREKAQKQKNKERKVKIS